MKKVPFLIFGATLLLIACRQDYFKDYDNRLRDQDNIGVANVSIVNPKTSMLVQQHDTLNLKIYYTNNTFTNQKNSMMDLYMKNSNTNMGVNLLCTTNDSKVASVSVYNNQAFVVTGVGEGKALINIYVSENACHNRCERHHRHYHGKHSSYKFAAQYTVTITNSKIALNAITLGTHKATLSTGETDIPQVSATPNNATQNYTLVYTSSNTNVATITKDEFGNNAINAIGAGTTTITISVQDHPEITAISYELTITNNTKTTIDASSVAFAGGLVDYDGAAHTIVASNLPANVSVVYSNATLTNPTADNMATATLKVSDPTLYQFANGKDTMVLSTSFDINQFIYGNDATGDSIIILGRLTNAPDITTVVIPNKIGGKFVAWLEQGALTSDINYVNGSNQKRGLAINAHITTLDMSHTEKLSTIRMKAIDGLAVSSLTIPAFVNFLGYNAMANCPNLKTVYFQSTTPPQLYDGATNNGNLANANAIFFNTPITTIHVPATSENIYKSTWDALTTMIIAP